MKGVGFSDADISSLDRGPVVRVVPRKDDNDVFVVGVVRIAAPPASLVDALKRIETFRDRPPILEIGRFSSPPRIEDLTTLSFDARDLDLLRACKLGDCDIKVDAGTIELARRIDWKARDAYFEAARLMKGVMLAQATRYLQEGALAMTVYNDNEVPEPSASETVALLEGDPKLLQFTPEFLKAFLDFPNGGLPSVENFIYWSKEKTRKTVVSIAHVAIDSGLPGTGYRVAMKHLYDSHFFLANLEFLTLVPEEGGASAFTLVHVLRARVDPPRSFRGMILGKIRVGMRDALDQDLGATKRRLEEATQR
jgi:hypothetical protein